jgi:uncharacterized protein (UPF0332 family)
VSEEEIRQVLQRSLKDLETAAKVMDLDTDWGFAVAYNAVLQASRAFMFSQGFRPASKESHKNTFAFMRLALTGKAEDLVTYFDRMRTKRHTAVYDTVGSITETEAHYLLDKAREFVEMIRRKIAEGS